MNKDLEIIKEQSNLIVPKGQCCQSPKYNPINIILSSAERMAAEIERKDAKIEELRTLVSEYKRINEVIKAELEKRPEVIYCEGCIYKNQCKAAVIFQESTPKMEGPFKFYYLKFCSFGQRKSEVGK